MQVWNEYATEYRAKRDELLSVLTEKYRAAEESGDAETQFNCMLALMRYRLVPKDSELVSKEAFNLVRRAEKGNARISDYETKKRRPPKVTDVSDAWLEAYGYESNPYDYRTSGNGQYLPSRVGFVGDSFTVVRVKYGERTVRREEYGRIGEQKIDEGEVLYKLGSTSLSGAAKRYAEGMKGLYERLRKERLDLSVDFSNGESGISEIVLHEHNAYQLKSIGYAVYCYGDKRVKGYVLLDSEGLGVCKISEDETFSRIEQALKRHDEALGSGIEVIKL